jgi:SAM-dependent methyltransferase
MTDFEAIKRQQQHTWALGDFAMIGWNTVYPGELLCEAVDLRAGERVLDVATGSGNTALSAARRNCDATGIDYVPALIERARQRAAAEHLSAKFEVADCEEIPFADGNFDIVLSVYGSMFAAWRTGHRRASGGRPSRSWRNIFRRQRGCEHQPNGGRKNVSRNCSAKLSHPLAWHDAAPCFASAAVRTGSRCSAGILARSFACGKRWTISVARIFSWNWTRR